MSKKDGHLISSQTASYLLMALCLYDALFSEVNAWTYCNLVCAAFFAVTHVNEKAREKAAKAQAERKDKGDKL